MADVRLTATNPEDSSVVPVACNEKGELKLEEPLVVEGPPGEKGEKGDKGDPGDPFSGNFADDVTFGGNATFAGRVGINRESDPGARLNVQGTIRGIGLETYSDSDDPQNSVTISLNGTDGSAKFADGKVFIDHGGGVYLGTSPLDESPYTNRTISLNNNGTATFAGNVQTGGRPVDGTMGALQTANGQLWAATANGANVFTGFLAGSGTPRVEIASNGSATFAGNKAGFTAEGHLWCTTRRGDTVILDVTSNGLASWVPYTPPNRLTELQDRWAEKNGIRPMPEESSQDEPETKQ